jgi:zinc transporter, ZIP family
MEFLNNLGPEFQALIATLFTWLVTAAGAVPALFFKKINKKVFNVMLGFAAGVMIAASFYSLLLPAATMADQSDKKAWAVVTLGFLLGGGFLKAVDIILDKFKHSKNLSPSLKRSGLLVLSVTIHNIPEGLAIGVAFGAVAAGIPEATLSGAFLLALGIGIQNFPEGAAVAMPLLREGFSRKKAFFFGQLSGIVEPIAGVMGAMLVRYIRPMLPYSLAFAAGAMIYVVVDALVPASVEGGEPSSETTIGAMLGFAVMMCLDVALG